jgi:hypothetical protein
MSTIQKVHDHVESEVSSFDKGPKSGIIGTSIGVAKPLTPGSSDYSWESDEAKTVNSLDRLLCQLTRRDLQTLLSSLELTRHAVRIDTPDGIVEKRFSELSILFELGGTEENIEADRRLLHGFVDLVRACGPDRGDCELLSMEGLPPGTQRKDVGVDPNRFFLAVSRGR